MRALLVVLALASLCAFSRAQSGPGSFPSEDCDCDDGNMCTNDVADQHWRFIWPGNVEVECNRNEPSVQYNNEEDEIFSARYTGYAYEQNRCEARGDCDDDDQDCDRDGVDIQNDDDGGGVNNFVTWRWEREAGDCEGQPPGSFCDTTVTDQCGLTTVTRTFASMSVCTCDDPGALIFGEQIITEVDSSNPIVFPPADVVLECGDSTSAAHTGIPRIHDRCDPNPSFINGNGAAGEDVENNIGCPTVITRSWEIQDCSGNPGPDQLVPFSHTITIVDSYPPIFEDIPEDMRVQCPRNIPEETLSTYDVCDGRDDTGEFRDVVTMGKRGECDQVIERTYVAVDNCGNTAYVTQTIVVEDTQPPTFQTVFDDVEFVQCRAPLSGQFLPVAVGVTDNCDTFGAAAQPEVVDQPSAEAQGEYDRYIKWTAEDSCGNVATMTRRIHYVVEVDMTLSVSPLQSIMIPYGDDSRTVTVTLTNEGPCDLEPGEAIIKFNPYPLVLHPLGESEWNCDDPVPVPAGIPTRLASGEIRCSNLVPIASGGASNLEGTFSFHLASLGGSGLYGDTFEVVFTAESEKVADLNPFQNSVTWIVSRTES